MAGWRPYGHLAIIYVVWGTTYLAVKVCLGGPTPVTPVELQAWRLCAATLILALISGMTTRTLPKLSPRDFVLCALIGLFMWVLGNGLATVAAQHASSGFIVMALGTIPLWTTMLSSLTSRTLPSRWTTAGLLLGIVGLSAIFAPPILQGQRSAMEPGYEAYTALLLTAAGLTWSIGSVLQRRLSPSLPATWAACLQMGMASVVLTGLMVFRGDALIPPLALDAPQIMAFSYLVVFGSTVSLLSYLRVIAAFSATTASTFAYVNPLIGVTLGWIILGEVPSRLSICGMALILGGVFLVLTGKTPFSPPYQRA